ncbi:6-phospho-3-hexuloisomerase [Oceanobacillus timonensis]|uniref:6-phospho-3-hexuloisomerase n=1 Tax=Oceanobacillus timonensis TaxID=1926285 RepID=UPI0009B967BC|nr:6-phospho-3-hexuloisomerase [Oceanobacillus timonensis]
MSQPENLLAIIKELKEDAKSIEQKQIQQFSQAILNANRIFVAGVGRSGFVARAFSNRLMHLGFMVYFVGEPTTPSIGRGDLLIIGSGSGETKSLVSMAEKANEKGADIATVTIFPENSVGKQAQTIIKVPGVTAKSNNKSDKTTSIQPLGSSFEQLVWLIYDSVIMDLKEQTEQSDEQMLARHANLE